MADHKIAEIQPEMGRKTLSSNIIGFILSAILLIVMFILVQKKLLPNASLYITLTVLLFLQIIIQVICFLRLNTKTENDKWNLMALFFTFFIIFIIVCGSLWIMYNLNYYMVH